MEGSSSRKKSKFSVLIVIIMIAVVVGSVVFYRAYVATLSTSRLIDPSNDVVLDVGAQYPGMVDVVGAALEVDGTVLNVTVAVREAYYSLGDGEIAQWNVTVILENETDVLRTYEVGVKMNSTQLTCSVVDVETENVQIGQVSYLRDSLAVLAVMDELSNAETVEWRILTSYEQYFEGELIVSAWDLAPDEGLQKTFLEP